MLEIVKATLSVPPSHHAPPLSARLNRMIRREELEKVPPLCVGKEVLFRPVMYEAVARFAKDIQSIRLSSREAMWMPREPAIRSLLPDGKNDHVGSTICTFFGLPRGRGFSIVDRSAL